MPEDNEALMALAAFGLVDPEAADVEADADTELGPEAVDDVDEDADGADDGSDAVVVLPTRPTPNARVDSPSRVH
jgi:hypothetical protein